MGMISTYGDFLDQKKKNLQIRQTAGKLGTPVALSDTGTQGSNGVSDPYPNTGNISYEEGLSEYYGIGNTSQIAQPQSLGEALGGGNLIATAKPVTQNASNASGTANTASTASGSSSASVTPKQQYGVSYAEGFDLMNQSPMQKVSAKTNGSQASMIAFGPEGGSSAENNGDMTYGKYIGETYGTAAPATGKGVGERSGRKPTFGEIKPTVTPTDPAEEPTDPAENNGDMTYGEYLDKTYGGDAAKKNYDRAVENAETDYARAKSTYGQRAETLGRVGLTGSGYGDYLEGLAYSEMQGAKRDAALTRDSKEAEQQASYAQYIESKQNEGSTTYKNWMTASANKTYDLETTKALVAEDVKSGKISQEQADAILANYGSTAKETEAAQRPAAISSLTAAIIAEGITEESKIRAAIDAFQPSYGVTLTEEEIAGVVANIQGITGTGNTGTSGDGDEATPPSERVATALGYLTQTDDNGNLVFAEISDEYLKNTLIQQGYTSDEADDAIKRFRSTVELSKKESYNKYLADVGVGSGKLILGDVVSQIANVYGTESEEWKNVKTAIHKQNKEILDTILSDNFDINSLSAETMLSSLIGNNNEFWRSMSASEKWNSVKDAILNDDKDFNDNDTSDFLARYYARELQKTPMNNLSDVEVFRTVSKALIDCANDAGGLGSAAVQKLKEKILESGISFGLRFGGTSNGINQPILFMTNTKSGKTSTIMCQTKKPWGVDTKELDRICKEEPDRVSEYVIDTKDGGKSFTAVSYQSSVFIKEPSGRWRIVDFKCFYKLTPDQGRAIMQLWSKEICEPKQEN